MLQCEFGKDIGGYELVKKQIQEEIIDLLVTKDDLIQRLQDENPSDNKIPKNTIQRDIAELETLIPKEFCSWPGTENILPNP